MLLLFSFRNSFWIHVYSWHSAVLRYIAQGWNPFQIWNFYTDDPAFQESSYDSAEGLCKMLLCQCSWSWRYFYLKCQSTMFCYSRFHHSNLLVSASSPGPSWLGQGYSVPYLNATDLWLDDEVDMYLPHSTLCPYSLPLQPLSCCRT